MNSKIDANGMNLSPAAPAQKESRTLPAAVAIWGDLSEYGIVQPCELQPTVVPSAPGEHENTTEEQMRSWKEVRIAEALFQSAVATLPEDVFYISDALGDEIPHWGPGRYVIDAGTGSGKTTAIMNLLKKIVEETPEFEVEGRKRILYLCNRTALKEQIVQAIFDDGVDRDFRDYDRIQWDMIQCLSFEFVDVWTYQKLQKDYRENPEKTLEYVKRHYTYVICDEAHYFVNDAKFNHKTNSGYQCIEQLISSNVVIYMSATMQPLIKKWKEENLLVPERYYRIPRRKSCISEIRFYYRDAERKALLDAIPPEEKIIVFVTSRTALENMKRIYGDSASYFCSGNNKGGAMDELHDCIKSGKLLKRILFTTTVLYNGIDIKDSTVKHLFIEQWMPMEIIQEIGRKRPVNEGDTCKLYLRGRGKRELENQLKEANRSLEPALCYYTGGEAWEKFLSVPDANARIGEESVLDYDHKTGMYHVNEMKEALFSYQKDVVREMLLKGYHDALLGMLWDDLGGRIPEYKADDVSVYIAEHLNERMRKEKLKADLISLLGMVPAKGRSSKEVIGIILLNRELQKYGVKIESGRGTAGKWRNKTFWMLVELT